MDTYKNLTLCMITLLCITLTGCAVNSSQSGQNLSATDVEEDIYDPMENINRTVFNMNDALDKAVADPVARGYRAVMPKFVRDSVRNFLRNLRSPVNVANQVLQGDVEGAAGDITRFAMNTTIGIGGLFDVAADTGLEYEHEDFGQTLGVWGVNHGPYMVLPFMGPSSLRDTTGMLVDTLADPVRLYLYNTHHEEWYYARVGATALDKREELLDALDDLRRNSFDYYAAIRSAYMQKRHALVRDDDPQTLTATSIPDYDDE